MLGLSLEAWALLGERIGERWEGRGAMYVKVLREGRTFAKPKTNGIVAYGAWPGPHPPLHTSACSPTVKPVVDALSLRLCFSPSMTAVLPDNFLKWVWSLETSILTQILLLNGTTWASDLASLSCVIGASNMPVVIFNNVYWVPAPSA